ncbi:tetratricopeptide repeat protein [candidate division KSB1 bacterium]
MKKCISRYHLFALTVLLPLFSGTLSAQSGREKVNEGNELFNQEKYSEALNKYRDAAIDDPQSPLIQYNIGDALYKQGMYEEAFQSFENVLSADDSDLHFRSYYNMGNALYRMDKLPESILSYKKALELNPDDYDSKYNLEFVRNKLKQQRQNQNQQQNTGDEQQQQGQQSGEQQEEQSGEQQQTEEQQRELTQEEAERILNALQNDEKDLQEKRTSSSKSSVRVKKDW